MKLASHVLLTVIIIAVFTAIIQTWPVQKVHDTANTQKSANAKVKENPVKKERKFDIKILNVEETGTLSRKIAARLMNKEGYAKNVRVYIELLLDGEVIKINGEDRLEINVGDMKPNESVDKTVELSVSFFDGLKIKSKGYVDAKLVIKWDGGREVFRKRVQL